VLDALAATPERRQFRLDTCGRLWDESQIREQIERLRLGSLVHLHGFLSEDEVERKLSTAHVAINLRYPSMGEASLSQLQFWDYGLPTMVTRTGWYTSLPEDAAAFVRPEEEVRDIQAHLRAFLSDPEAFQARGERGRRSLRNNDPERYVEEIVQFAGEALRFAPRVPALALAHKVGSDLSAWLPPSAGSYLLDRASQEIVAILEERSGR
jgi:glycosyltransferase involved in cell wall biosynthesis